MTALLKDCWIEATTSSTNDSNCSTLIVNAGAYKQVATEIQGIVRSHQIVNTLMFNKHSTWKSSKTFRWILSKGLTGYL